MFLFITNTDDKFSVSALFVVAGGSWAFSDSRGHYVHRQSSEDSGFSSCGSSASSIADDSEIAGYPVLSAYKSSLVSSNEKKVPAYRCSPNSGTVASVLAAGISSDFEESDEEVRRIQRSESVKMGAISL